MHFIHKVPLAPSMWIKMVLCISISNHRKWQEMVVLASTNQVWTRITRKSYAWSFAIQIPIQAVCLVTLSFRSVWTWSKPSSKYPLHEHQWWIFFLVFTKKKQNVSKFYIPTYYNQTNQTYIGTYPGSHIDKNFITPVLGQFNVWFLLFIKSTL